MDFAWCVIIVRLVRPQTYADTGWSYIFFPTLEMYRMPYHDLIPPLRLALQAFQRQGRMMEAKWEARIPHRPFKGKKSLLSRPPLSTRKSWSRRNKDIVVGPNDHRVNSPGLSDKRRDREHRTLVKVNLQSKPKKLVLANDVEKASVDFFKKLSQKVCLEIPFNQAVVFTPMHKRTSPRLENWAHYWSKMTLAMGL